VEGGVGVSVRTKSLRENIEDVVGKGSRRSAAVPLSRTSVGGSILTKT